MLFDLRPIPSNNLYLFVYSTIVYINLFCLHKLTEGYAIHLEAYKFCSPLIVISCSLERFS